MERPQQQTNKQQNDMISKKKRDKNSSTELNDHPEHQTHTKRNKFQAAMDTRRS